MWPARWAAALLSLTLLLAQAGASPSSTSVSADNSYWYDWGLYGVYPQKKYESFGASSPWTNVLRSDPRCSDGYIFIEPRGLAVTTPGPIILDQEGNLVWIQTKWGQAMDVKVQTYQGNEYITFWHGSDNGTFGQGYYLMLNSSYDVFKKVTPAGNFSGDLHDFRITPEGTAMMTIYEKLPWDLSDFGISDGWIIDSLFQEIDLATGALVFQWRASEHFAVADTLAPIAAFGSSEALAFDFFHINSVDRDGDGNYIVSSRYMCAVACLDPAAGGAVVWQLGGRRSSFADLSGGAASNFSWQHHATWYEGDLLTIFDNGAYDALHTAAYSRGLLVALDRANMTAELVQDFVAPQRLLVPSQGSVQRLLPGNSSSSSSSSDDNAEETVLVGWGHTPAYTEFSASGEPLCDVHLGAVNLAGMGWCKNYRTFKYRWVGRPSASPDVAMRPKRAALYASWNGATEVRRWVLQSGASAEGAFEDHGSVEKTTFETRLDVPEEAREYVRAAAIDKDGAVLGYSRAVSRHEETKVEPMEAPPQTSLAAVVGRIAGAAAAGVIAFCALVYCFRGAIARGFDYCMTEVGRGISKIWRRPAEHAHKYEMLPTG